MRQDIIFVANKEIGTKESPANSNLQKYGAWYGLNGVAWCAEWVSWVFNEAGHPLPHIDTDKGFHYVPTIVNWATHNNKLTTDPQPGDIVCYDWQKGTPNETAEQRLSDHTGIFLRWVDRNAGTFEAIEGNTSVGNDSAGGIVMLRQRKTAFVTAFINPLNLPNT